MSVGDRSGYAPNSVSEEAFVGAVSEMAREVWDFHNRWGFGSGHFVGDSPASVVKRRRAILSEEIRELDEAVADDDGDGICSEAADVLFVALGHIEALGEGGIEGMRRVTRKNGGKTEETHAIREDTGKLLPKEGKPHKWA